MSEKSLNPQYIIQKKNKNVPFIFSLFPFSFYLFPFIFFLLSFILITSCTSPYKNLPVQKIAQTEIKKIPYSLPYSEKTHIYKTNIHFYKNEISGLIIIKKTGEQVYRIALTTQFGLNIFDFQLNNGELKVKYCVEYLNKKMILKTFQNDFNLLLMQNQFEKIMLIENTPAKEKIWQLKSGKNNYLYLQDTDKKEIKNIKYKKRRSEKISIALTKYKEELPSEIELKHKNIKFEMKLKLLK